MNKNLKVIIGLISLLCILSLSISFWIYYKISRIGFVDTIKLVNEYRLKTDLEKIEEEKLAGIRTRADSLNVIYKLAKTTSVDALKVRELEGQLVQLRSLFQEEYNRSNQEINEKVWRRLNTAIDKYARKGKMQLLIGANGMGTVLYGSPSMDHTNDLIQFVNSEYQHGN